ncbi:SDR family oxidoreductase [Luteibacter aegosomaticola]|uniref:SDR family oxidoreductase n=1 Tax=Luteibacter aegosomaticola TaxID=2911538 RepID=UPI001FF99B13|nr:SDR family oxidoreductase [Luteibacter aegosomaticola]UPG92246.1 SDR family oxidoreductase [Luteibacter aegosomaticola]
MSDSKIWFITGCSTGFGRELAEQVLARGERVVLTARKPEQVQDIADKYPETALAVALDVTSEQAIRKAVADAEARFGRVDVLVNNAGYGYFSAVEEGEDEEIRRQFETNVFGLISLTRHVLPGMRQRRSGHIVNVSSIGGLVAFPATGYYHATKWAVEGFSESLSKEVGPLGIKVVIVEPGRFRTDWAGRSVIESKTVIADYDATAGERRRQAKSYTGTQPGDPARGAAAIIQAVDAENPPLRLPLGSDAYKFLSDRLEELRTNFEAVKDISTSTDFPS